MITDLKPYPRMKMAGLPWLDEIPEQWKLQPNRALMRQRKVLVGDRFAEYQLLSLTKQGVLVRDVAAGRGKFSADMKTFQEVRVGDLVFCLFDIPETPRTVGLSRHEGMITGAYTIFECSDPSLSAFIDLFYRALDDRKLLSPLYSGLRNTIPVPRFLSTRTPVPPQDERAAIVRFLGHADRRIRRAIHAKQKLIALLNEQKLAVMRHAVTRGFDPGARLKPSGVDWLGDIPIHWETRPISACIVEKQAGLWGADPSSDNTDQHIACVRVADFDTERLRVSTSKLTTRAVPKHSLKRRLLACGDVLIEKSGGGDAEPVGRVVLYDLPERAICSNFVTLIRPNTAVIHPEWLLSVLAVMQAIRRNVPCIKQTTGIQNLDESAYFSLRIAVPPLDEQARSIARLREAERTHRALVEGTRSEIALLREYQTRLIADVVTGKLDVGDRAARLPHEVDELELSDELELEESEEPAAEDLEAVEA